MAVVVSMLMTMFMSVVMGALMTMFMVVMLRVMRMFSVVLCKSPVLEDLRTSQSIDE